MRRRGGRCAAEWSAPFASCSVRDVRRTGRKNPLPSASARDGKAVVKTGAGGDPPHLIARLDMDDGLDQPRRGLRLGRYDSLSFLPVCSSSASRVYTDRGRAFGMLFFKNKRQQES